MQDSFFTVRCADLFYLRARSWGDSLESPKGLVVLVHGMAEYGARYDAFALALVQKGFRVWAADHRGHGLNITRKSLDVMDFLIEGLGFDVDQLAEMF